MTWLFRPSPLVHAGLLALCTLVPGRSAASRQNDSLMTVVDGASDPAARAKALLELGRQRMRVRPAESLTQSANALVFARRSGERPLIHRVLELQRDLQLRYGAVDEFLRVCMEATDVSTAMGDAAMIAADLQWMSVAYEKLGDMDQAVDLNRKAVFLLRTAGDSAALGRGMLNLLNALVKAGRFKEVVAQGDEALKLFIDREDSSSQAGIWTRTGEALLANGRAADALPLLIRAETVLAGSGPAVEHIRALGSLAHAYHVLGDHARAQDRIDSALARATLLDLRDALPSLFELSSRVHEAQGDLQRALADERRRRSLQDSLLDMGVAERMLGMRELYQRERTERELEEVKARNEANETLIADARTRNRVWLAVFIVVLASLVWALFLIIGRRKAARRLRLKNQVIRQQAEQINANNLELERRNLRLAEALMNEERKAALLKEVHHRVKNNLQIVNALLRLQSEHTTDKHLAIVLNEAQGRIKAMATVHENLYLKGDLDKIDLQAHLAQLAHGVFNEATAPCAVQLDVRSQVRTAPMDTMLPLSLLVNELLTNAAKHAFTGEHTGRIRLLLNDTGDGRCELFYSDDGIGLRPDAFHGNSFGMSLIRAFVEQLEGDVRMIEGEGTTLVISFPIEAPRLRKAS